MTRAAEQRLLAKLRSGQPVTVTDHIPTIDSAGELAAFMGALKANGRMTDEAREAGLRREQQLMRR